MSKIAMGPSSNRQIRAPRRKRARNPNWHEEFYKNGYPTEVIVIEDTPSPAVSSQHTHHVMSAHEIRGTKRGRRTPPLVFQQQNSTAFNYYQQVSAQQIISTDLTHNSKRRRRVKERTITPYGSHLQPLPPAYMAPNSPPYYQNDDYRSYISTSSHASTAQYYREPIKSNEGYYTIQSYSSATPSRPPPMPAYDDQDGHYIVHPGDDLIQRYKVIRILGQGTFGKVIQCWDRAANRHVAVKIIRAVQKYRDASKIEIRVLNAIKQADPHNNNRCIHLRDYFEFRNHICMVFDLLGSSIFDFLKNNDFNPFPMSQIQHISRQLLTSVDFLHRNNLVHTDLKPENILLETDHYRSIPTRTRMGRKEIKELYNTDIRVIDFGSATFEDEYHSTVVSTRHYRAPEVILGLGWSFPCDVWSVGCILVELFTGEALFQTHENLEHLAMMEQVLGEIPVKMAQRSSRYTQEKYFDKNSKLNYPNQDTNRQSKKYVRELHSLKDIIKPHLCSFNKHFYDLVLGLLEYDPAIRLTPRQALRHQFFYITFDSEGRQFR